MTNKIYREHPTKLQKEDGWPFSRRQEVDEERSPTPTPDTSHTFGQEELHPQRWGCSETSSNVTYCGRATPFLLSKLSVNLPALCATESGW
jgi:hypothetical protein